MVVGTITFTTYKNDALTESGTPLVIGFRDKDGDNIFDNNDVPTDADIEIPPPPPSYISDNPPPVPGEDLPLISTSYIDTMFVKVFDGTTYVNAYQYFIDSTYTNDISLNLAVRDNDFDNVVFKYSNLDISGVFSTLAITNDVWTIDLVNNEITGTVTGGVPSINRNGDLSTVIIQQLNADIFYELNLKQYVAVDTGPTVITLNVVKGWNMFGLSANGSLTDPNSLIISGTIYWFSGTGYGSSVSPSNLTANKGYWIKCSGSGEITLTLGVNINTLPNTVDLTVVKGWNMFGLSKNGSLTDTNSLIISGTIYWFNGTGYGSSVSPSNLTANKGYWIKCSDPGRITLTLA